MNTLSINVRYRPVRIGWCVRAGDFAALREAVRLSYAIWGGRYNPIIQIDDAATATALVQLFRVDVLWPISKDESIKEFIKKFAYLPNPFHHEDLFVKYSNGERHAQLADIYHPIQRCYEDNFKNNPKPELKVAICEWQPDDALADALLISYGGFPPVQATGTDYAGLLGKYLAATTVAIPNNGPVPERAENEFAMSWFSRAYMKQHYSVRNHWGHPGVYVGDPANFDDLVNFWNLRATDTYLMFYSPQHAQRLDGDRDRWLGKLRSRPKGQFASDNSISVWVKDDSSKPDLSGFGQGLVLCTVRDGTWNGLNMKAPYMYFSEGSALGAIGDSSLGLPNVSFQLPAKPFAEETRLFEQHVVVAVNPGIGLFGNERATLHTPYIPELNEYYGRECLFDWDAARAELDGLGIISNASRSDLSLTALDTTGLVSRIFRVADIDATPSKAGLIATRLIRQMGGLQRCRPFKIPGVRNLIKKYGPDKWFTRSGAIEAIRDVDPATNVPSFAEFEEIYIEQRAIGTKLKPDAVLGYLLRKGVFRAGLRFDCPSCRLQFWISLDEARTETTCEYCGDKFNVTPHLKDRDWAFRRSGLFGRDDNQEGAIPVALTLMQLDSTFTARETLYSTAMSLEFKATKVQCETDFVIIGPRGRSGQVDVAIGECKTRDEITADDVANLKAVADAFPTDRFSVYVIFSKLAPFSPAEVSRIRAVNDQYRRRAIVLTPRELEPYHLYDRTEKEFKIDRYAVSFEDMAKVTEQVYYAEQGAQAQ